MISSEPSDSSSPAWLASFSGAEEKPVSASSAKRSILPADIWSRRRSALRAVVGEGHLLEADPGDHAADEARLLGHRQQASSARRLISRKSPASSGMSTRWRATAAVEAVRGGALERGLARAAAAHAIDHVGAFARITSSMGRAARAGPAGRRR
jgi:hypothetical protein